MNFARSKEDRELMERASWLVQPLREGLVECQRKLFVLKKKQSLTEGGLSPAYFFLRQILLIKI